ncbi:MAG TPA: hypothetical protein PKE44_03525 [Plasticicumulans sp.]|uniref:hypothetical protein n=1 Tax=Plasticicumulans sp. TaxID=2307179 RepID=UPI002CE2336A|nr:hypothetical protein [Plasticicumulans sp.]HMW28622.1 hypothetical protein [Plasticicumulans sp.]HMW43554.1 hypothetical protein [Plasticicumulans sp.]HMZ09654.1 hypothetical protein [Plasticicumulans sp.]
MKSIVVTLAALAAAATLGACSQVPMPESYPLSYQKKMQAAHHWDLLAMHVAQRLSTQLPSDRPVSLYVTPPRPVTTFDYALHDLVVTHLVSLGFGVSAVPMHGALQVDLKTQVVQHTCRDMRPQPGSFVAVGGAAALGGLAARSTHAAMGAGAILLTAGEFLSGGIYETPNTEIIVSTSVMDGPMYRTRLRDIYYVSDENVAQYLPDMPAPVTPDLSRRIEVVGR